MICTFRAFASGRLWPISGLPRCPFLHLPTIVQPRSAACGTDRECLQELGLFCRSPYRRAFHVLLH